MRVFTLLFLFLLSSNVFSQSNVKVIHVRKAKEEKCSATLLGRSGGKISLNELMTCNKIEVTGPCDYKVVYFVFSATIKGKLIEFKCDSVLSGKAKTVMMPGERFFIERIKVKSNITGQVFWLPNLKFKVVE